MIPGAVSNCWRQQLRENTPLPALIAAAVDRRLRTIELRQTCMGEYEYGTECIPSVPKLAELSGQFSDTQFSIAIALPFLTPVNQNPFLFQTGLEAALAVAGRFPPHLRLVDLTTQAKQLKSSDIAAITSSIDALVTSATDAGVMLSVENSIQPWNYFRSIFDQVCSGMSDRNALRLCYDPANLLLQTDAVEPAVITRSLSAAQLSMVHFKQRSDGRFLDSVRDGDIDWEAQLQALAQIKYDGLALFEIESSAEVWHCLDASLAYLQARGLDHQL